MNEKYRKRRDFVQNILIAVLSVSAVLLFAQTQVSNLGSSSYLRFFSGSTAQTSSTASSQTAILTAPVRVAVTSPYGRYGSVTLSTTDEEFDDPLGTLLGEVLGSARTYAACDSQAFLDALTVTSVYYDFLEPLPLSVLAGLVGGTTDEDDISARRLVVADQADGVFLYLWDGAGTCLRCSTAISKEALEKAVGRYEPGNAQFAFDNAEPGSLYQDVAPCSLFLETEPVLPVLTADMSLSDSALLLTSLGFNPNTKYRYPESSGAEVIMEGGRSLRIGTDGSVSYQSGGDPALTVKAAEELPTLQEAAAETSALLNTLLGSAAGDAALYLQSIQRSGSTTVLTFGYQVNGVPIRFSDGGNAAEVTLSGTTVYTLDLRFRQYTAAGTDSLLLPLSQALAIAAMEPGVELSIGYVDNGSGTVSASWLAD